MPTHIFLKLIKTAQAFSCLDFQHSMNCAMKHVLNSKSYMMGLSLKLIKLSRVKNGLVTATMSLFNPQAFIPALCHLAHQPKREHGNGSISICHELIIFSNAISTVLDPYWDPDQGAWLTLNRQLNFEIDANSI